MQFNLNTLIVGAGIAGIQAALDKYCSSCDKDIFSFFNISIFTVELVISPVRVWEKAWDIGFYYPYLWHIF